MALEIFLIPLLGNTRIFRDIELKGRKMVEERVKQQKWRDSENSENRAMIDFMKMLVKGIEPPTYALRVRCSTPELHQHMWFDDIPHETTKIIIILQQQNASPILTEKSPETGGITRLIFPVRTGSSVCLRKLDPCGRRSSRKSIRAAHRTEKALHA